ncbi:nucleotidyltransferase domain-containing protein [Methylobacterium ajmalii]|jgi:predicted nucleotidyltransferase|uniref:Nucleotidyltransferase domain-containing protein n=3 Tax=Pseudomonadota TaxID=1224 RepID=A0ABV0A7M8_9HYPH|nr:nucleotidyltransferase domain-containing protein [uncultured Methylobacterium sp.]
MLSAQEQISFVAKNLASADEILRVINLDFKVSNYCAAILGGSLADGFANRYSDVDIYLIIKNKSDLPSSTALTKYLSDRHWHVHFLPVETLNEIEENIAKNNYKFSDPEKILIHRLYYGMIIDGSTFANDWRSNVNFKKYTKHIAFSTYNWASGTHRDCLGMYEASDGLGYTQAIRMGLGYLVDSLLYAMGNTIPRHKWRLRMISETIGNSNFLENYVQKTSFVPINYDNLCPSIVQSQLRIWQLISSQVILKTIILQDDLDNRKISQYLNNASLYNAPPADNLDCNEIVTPTRTLDSRLDRMGGQHGDRLVLVQGYQNLAVSPLIAAIWCYADGQRNIDQISTQILTRASKIDNDKNLCKDKIIGAINNMISKKLLS